MKHGKKNLMPKLRFPEFEVSSGLERRKIGDMLTETPRPIDLEDETDYCLVTVKRRYGGLVSRGVLKGKEIKVSSQFLVKAGDFVVSKRQIVHDACGLVPHELEGCVVSNEYSVLTAKTGCNIDFFNRFAQQPCVSASFIECSVGIVIEKMLFKLPLWLRRAFLFPAIAEQKKIADCLGSLDELIAAQARKVDALKTHKKGLMQQLFPREGETQPRLRFPEFQDAGGWAMRALNEIVEIASGQVDPKEPPYCDYPQIGGENIESNTGRVLNVKTAGEKGVISGNYVFDERAILYSKIRPALNKVAAPEFKGICSADIYPIYPVDGSLLRIYLLFLLLSEKFLEYAIRNSERGKIPKINRNALLTYKVLIPSTEEQQRIADCLTSLDTLIIAATQELQTLKTHKKGLMQQLFPSVEAEEA